MVNRPELAFVFPGQGSQQVGMLAEMAHQHDITRATFAQASEQLGFDLWQLVSEGPQDKLNLTENAQPALLAASVALWRQWAEFSELRPAVLSGHSLGEWSALVCAGVLAFEDAIRLVNLRGRFMQEAVPVGVGAMAAIIGLDDKTLNQVCAEVAQDEVVTPVNYNSPGQVVIAGHSAAVDRAMAAGKDAGAKRALPLAVSAPFHTSLMQPAAQRLAKEIAQTEFRAPQIPVVHNVHGKTESDPAQIKRLMEEQIYAPVLWVDCVHTMKQHGATQFVECGPGKVLSGLLKRIDKSLNAYAIETPSLMQDCIAQLEQ